MVGLISAGYLAAFLLLYGNVLHPAYQAELQGQPYFGVSVSSPALAATIVLIGVIAGGLVSFTGMMTEDGNGGDALEQRLEELSK